MKEFDYYDCMDSALAPIEAQRDDALEELQRVRAQRDELLSVMEDLMKFQVKIEWMELPIWVRAKKAIAKAKRGE